MKAIINKLTNSGYMFFFGFVPILNEKDNFLYGVIVFTITFINTRFIMFKIAQIIQKNINCYKEIIRHI